MNPFLCRGAGRRLSILSLAAALFGPSSLTQPAAAWATNRGCGQVFLANTHNELLRLHSSAEIFEFVAEFLGGNQVPPNGGVLNTVGNLGVDADDLVAFDIGPDNEALAAIRPLGSPFSRLYFIDLPSGRAIDLGRIGKGEFIVGLGIQLGPQCGGR